MVTKGPSSRNKTLDLSPIVTYPTVRFFSIALLRKWTKTLVFDTLFGILKDYATFSLDNRTLFLEEWFFGGFLQTAMFATASNLDNTEKGKTPSFSPLSLAFVGLFELLFHMLHTSYLLKGSYRPPQAFKIFLVYHYHLRNRPYSGRLLAILPLVIGHIMLQASQRLTLIGVTSVFALGRPDAWVTTQKLTFFCLSVLLWSLYRVLRHLIVHRFQVDKACPFNPLLDTVVLSMLGGFFFTLCIPSVKQLVQKILARAVQALAENAHAAVAGAFGSIITEIIVFTSRSITISQIVINYAIGVGASCVMSSLERIETRIFPPALVARHTSAVGRTALELVLSLFMSLAAGIPLAMVGGVFDSAGDYLSAVYHAISRLWTWIPGLYYGQSYDAMFIVYGIFIAGYHLLDTIVDTITLEVVAQEEPATPDESPVFYKEHLRMMKATNFLFSFSDGVYTAGGLLFEGFRAGVTGTTAGAIGSYLWYFLTLAFYDHLAGVYRTAR